MTENMAARGEGLVGLVAHVIPLDKLAEEWDRLDRYYSQLAEVAAGAGYDKGSFTGKSIGFSVCAAQLRAAAPAGTAHDELSLVRLVLSAHQTAYAKFHNGEGRGVIEADQMAIGYASVELAKALATPSPQAPPEPMCECTRGLDGTLLTMNCERHKRLVVPAATQEQPAGSGADDGPFTVPDSLPGHAMTHQGHWVRDAGSPRKVGEGGPVREPRNPAIEGGRDAFLKRGQD